MPYFTLKAYVVTPLIRTVSRTVLIRGIGWPSTMGSMSDSTGGPGLDTQSGYILSFLFWLIQHMQLSVTGKSMWT